MLERVWRKGKHLFHFFFFFMNYLDFVFDIFNCFSYRSLLSVAIYLFIFPIFFLFSVSLFYSSLFPSLFLLLPGKLNC